MTHEFVRASAQIDTKMDAKRTQDECVKTGIEGALMEEV